MPTEDFSIELFCRVDDAMQDVKKHRQALLYPSEIVTLAILFALKGVGNRAFYRRLTRDWRHLFPRLPHRTRLFRLFKTHRDWANRFPADPTVLGIIDSYGIEFIHPIREGRSLRQIGKSCPIASGSTLRPRWPSPWPLSTPGAMAWPAS